MKWKMESLYKNRILELVKLLKDNKIIGCKCAFKKKKGISSIEDARYKARLVAKDYSQAILIIVYSLEGVRTMLLVILIQIMQVIWIK